MSDYTDLLAWARDTDGAKSAGINELADALEETERLLAERTRAFEDAVKVANAEKQKRVGAERRIAAVAEYIDRNSPCGEYVDPAPIIAAIHPVAEEAP